MRYTFHILAIVAYYILCSVGCYLFTEHILYSLLFPIALPIIITLAFLGIYISFWIFLGIAWGLQYLNSLFLSKNIYITIKPILALAYFFIAYSMFTFVADNFFFEFPFVICPDDTHYYHWDINCYYLPDDIEYYQDEVEVSIFNAYLKGRKACNECVDYYSDLNARRYSFIAFGILYVLFIIAEYLYKNNLIPSLHSIKTFFKSIINKK